ncbi:hypothetical protein MD484_g2472, partial [Candolleomyces efflorescens]
MVDHPQESNDGRGEESPSPIVTPIANRKRRIPQTPYRPRKSARLANSSSNTSPLPSEVATPTTGRGSSPTAVQPSQASTANASSPTVIEDSEDGFSDLEVQSLAYLTDEFENDSSSDGVREPEDESNTSTRDVYLVDPSTGYARLLGQVPRGSHIVAFAAATNASNESDTANAPTRELSPEV